MNTENTPEVLLPWPRVRARLGNIGRTTCWRLQRDDETFPKAVPIGPRRIGWRESEINAWIEAQAAKVQG